MTISEKKMKIVIDNYFKSECNVDTSIREAFEKGFRIGVRKGLALSKADTLQTEVSAQEYERWLFKEPKTEPQTDCERCAEYGSYKCTKCDGEMYYKDTPQTDCTWR